MDTKAIRQRIYDLRKAKKLTQVDCAERLGMHKNTFGKIERGEIKLTEENITDIAAVLETTELYLMSGIDLSMEDQAEVYDGKDIYRVAYNAKFSEARRLSRQVKDLQALVDRMKKDVAEITEERDAAVKKKEELEQEIAGLRENQ